MNITLQAWISERPPLAQALFIRDNIAPLIGTGLDYEERRALPYVIGEHVSKSVRLPVYSLTRDDIGLRVVLRNNFYDWKMSVDSACAIDAPELAYLFNTTPPVEPEYTGDPLSSVYFEGFPAELIYGYRCADPRRFSASITGGDYVLWAAIHAIMRSVGAVKPRAWDTRASHAAELDAARERMGVRRAG